MADGRENFIVEQHAGRFKRHAAVLQLPLVDLDLLGRQRADEAHDSGLVRENTHDIDATLDPGVQSLESEAARTRATCPPSSPI